MAKSSYWTVGKLRDVIERYALVHQHSILDAVILDHETEELTLCVRPCVTRQEPAQRATYKAGEWKVEYLP